MTSPYAPPLSVRDVHHSYGKRAALKGISFELRAGEFNALLGPNGAGKTTLFALATRLLGLQRGAIEICGRPICKGAAALAPLGLVFQQPTLDLDLTVRQNLRYFAALRGLSQRQADSRIARELERLSMGERIGEKVRSLNGGHRRRVELARALLHEPSVLLLDEPSVGLDVESRARIVAHVHALAAERGLAVLWATHLIDEVRGSDALVILADGEVKAAGRAEDVVRQTGASDLAEAFGALTSRRAQPAANPIAPQAA